MADMNLRYEIRDDAGNIICATHDLSVAEDIARILSRYNIIDLNSAVSHVAWYQCDFSKYFATPSMPQVVICDTVYQQKKKRVEVIEYED